MIMKISGPLFSNKERKILSFDLKIYYILRYRLHILREEIVYGSPIILHSGYVQ